MKRWCWLIIVIAIGLLGGGLALWQARPTSSAPRPAPLVEGRRSHTATPLADGTILVVGGRASSGGPLARAERYDPRTGLWHDAGALRAARLDHTATRLPDGAVIVVGGVSGAGLPWRRDGLATVERYDPAANRWAALAPLPRGVTRHGAVLLADGRLLVAGGRERDGALAPAVQAAWAYDPARDRWDALAPPLLPHDGGILALLPDRRALLAGGTVAPDLALAPSAEIYEPQQDRWRTGPALGGAFIRGLTLANLADGRVLVADGEDTFLYDPASDRWARAAPGARLAFAGSLTALPDGRALVVAGAIQALYDPATDRWQIGQRPIPRLYHTATLLPDGRVVILGGQSVVDVGPGHDVEIIQP